MLPFFALGLLCCLSSVSPTGSSADSPHVLPLLPSAFSSSATVCEFYNQTCVDAAVVRGESSSHCSRNETCDSDRHNCYVVWSDVALNVGNATDEEEEEEEEVEEEEEGHSSGLRVKLMGCFMSGDECSKSDECLYDEQKARGGGHLFCCCRGSMCNAVFRSVHCPIIIWVELIADELLKSNV
jgi:hypothetical protein